MGFEVSMAAFAIKARMSVGLEHGSLRLVT
jgi:hypothetical protein